MREYYIRREGDEDSSGPYDIDQISSLMEASKLDADAFYYEMETESWEKISSNQEMMDTLFPQKQKLTLRKDSGERKKEKIEKPAPKPGAEPLSESDQIEAAAAENEKAEQHREEELDPEDVVPHIKLEVTKMLAQAEGRADDPSGKSPREKQAAVAYFGLKALTIYFIASILAMVYIDMDRLLAANAIEMAKSPYLIVAAFDLVLTVFLLLQVTEVYPLLRFRAAIGAGLISMLFYSSEDYIMLLSNLLIMVAIYFSSAIIKIRYLVACSIVGGLGVFGYAYAFFLS